jgi:hypothetical protein
MHSTQANTFQKIYNSAQLFATIDFLFISWPALFLFLPGNAWWRARKSRHYS